MKATDSERIKERKNKEGGIEGIGRKIKEYKKKRKDEEKVVWDTNERK